MTHSLPLYRKPPKKWDWRTRVRRMDEMTRSLKDFVKSATNQPDPNT